MRSSCFYLISAFLLLISCGGDDGDAGGGGNNGGDTQTPPPPSMVYLWRSNTTIDGSMGSLSGVSGGDTLCQGYAADAGLPSSVSTHRAVLATTLPDGHPRDYFSNNPSVHRHDGTLIADTWEEFFDGSENVHAPVIGFEWLYWTGFNGDGSVGDTCENWTSTSGQGAVGEGDGPDSRRLSSGNAQCVSSSSAALLCVSY